MNKKGEQGLQWQREQHQTCQADLQTHKTSRREGLWPRRRHSNTAAGRKCSCGPEKGCIVSFIQIMTGMQEAPGTSSQIDDLKWPAFGRATCLTCRLCWCCTSLVRVWRAPEPVQALHTWPQTAIEHGTRIEPTKRDQSPVRLPWMKVQRDQRWNAHVKMDPLYASKTQTHSTPET